MFKTTRYVRAARRKYSDYIGEIKKLFNDMRVIIMLHVPQRLRAMAALVSSVDDPIETRVNAIFKFLLFNKRNLPVILHIAIHICFRIQLTNGACLYNSKYIPNNARIIF